MFHMTSAAQDALTRTISRSPWHGWGDPADAHPLPDRSWTMLRRELGVTRRPQPTRPVALEDVRLPESRLAPDDLAALRAVVGTAYVHTDRLARVEHAAGKSYLDLRRLRDGDAADAPDVVVTPADATEIEQLLSVCRDRRLAVVPFGGGTSVVGGVTGSPGPFAAAVSIDLRRLNRMLSIDPVSRTAVFQPGMRGPDVEGALRPHGFTLGHYPQSHQEATIGGYVATRSAGQASTGYGRIDEIVRGATLATPEGTLRLDMRAPASAAGPRLLDLVVGSEGALGIITEVTMAIAPMPSQTAYAALAFPSFGEAAEGLRSLAQDLPHGIRPDVVRLSDPDETRVSLGLAGRAGQALAAYTKARRLPAACLVVLLWEGNDARTLRERKAASWEVLRRAGAVRMPSAIAHAWEKGRFSGPYLRDELMGHGVLVETLETATSWANLVALHDRVAAAIRAVSTDQGVPVIVQCHVSHVYPTGASLYFTVVAPEAADPLAQWRAVKTAATAAIVAGGGTVTHHHAVGTDHVDGLAAEVGELGMRVLRAVKDTLDPTGILNPGKLVR